MGKEFKGAMTGEVFEAYASENVNEEKVLKALKMLLAGYTIRISPEQRYVLFETVNGGFELAEAYENDTIVGMGLSLEGFTSLINKLDDEDFEKQYTVAIAGIVISDLKRKNRLLHSKKSEPYVPY